MLSDSGGEEGEGRDLGDERLRSGHADLRAGPDEQTLVDLAGDGAADGVGHRDRPHPHRLRITQRRERIGRLTRLGDRKCDGIGRSLGLSGLVLRRDAHRSVQLRLGLANPAIVVREFEHRLR